MQLPPSASIRLPADLHHALIMRRSVREFSSRPVTLEQLGAVLWAGQGITRGDGGRAAPSAGGFHPLRLYLAVGNVAELALGVYLYDPLRNALDRRVEDDRRAEVAQIAMNQSWMKESALIVAIAAEYSAVTQKYGKRAIRYLYVEAGAAGQNLALAAAALGLGTSTVGAFDDSALSGLLGLGDTEYPLTLMAVGVPLIKN